jgi:hypothetical protein
MARMMAAFLPAVGGLWRHRLVRWLALIIFPDRPIGNGDARAQRETCITRVTSATRPTEGLGERDSVALGVGRHTSV